MSVGKRINAVLHELGITKAHIAAKLPLDWKSLVDEYPDIVASLTLICPTGGIESQFLSGLKSSSLVFVGDKGDGAVTIRKKAAHMCEVELHTLKDYEGFGWSDVTGDRRDELFSVMKGFIDDHENTDGTPEVSIEEHGVVDGISYSAQGSGHPLVLLPLGLSAPQWDPILSLLSERYCTIVLRGPHLGMVPMLEARGRSGYIRVVNALMEEASPSAGDAILEVGCGTGVLDRWLARRTEGKNKIVGMDINEYLLNEAKELAKVDSFGRVIEFRHGSAEDIPFDDNSFDVVFSSTVMEEVDAHRMLGEMVRVTKSGGRVAVAVRATDLPVIVNLELSKALGDKVSANPGSAESNGCADASLYARFQDIGLSDVKMFPQLGTNTLDSIHFTEATIRSSLSVSELEEWEAAVAKAKSRGTYIISQPYHCAVGIK